MRSRRWPFRLTLAPSLHYTSAILNMRDQPRKAAGRRAEQEVFTMSRRCDLTGKSALTGHKVSHSNRKTKRRFLPNLCNVTLSSETLQRAVRMRVSANALKSVDHRGGLDAFLLKAPDAELSPKALKLKREISKKQGEAVEPSAA